MAGLLFRKVKDMRLALAQVTLVIAAFALMAFTSYSYTSKLERNHLLRDAQDALAYAQSYIEADLQEPKTALAGMAEATRNMVMNGADVDKVREWLGDITDYIMNSDDMMSHTAGVYGMFDCFGGQYIDGTDWAPDESYIPGERPWYTAAVEANGEIGVTAPYSDSSLDGGLTVTYARRIFDDSGNPLGIVCIDILLDRVRGYTSDMLLTDNSYGILLDGNLDIIAHPDSAYLGRSLYLLNDGPAIAADILSGKDFGSYDALSYQSERSALFYKRLSNGWYLGIMAPYNKYYQTIQNMAWFLALLGAGFAAVLSAVLLRVTAGKIRSDQESRQKSNFLATVSHEIRTPLNAIIGVAEIELQDEGLPPGFRDALVKIYTSGYSLLGIINDLLDLSKIEAGKMEITPAPYDTASLAYDTAQLNIMRLGSKPLEFDLRVDENTPAQLLGDELRIKQILNNLLSNAFKYTDTGKVTLEVRPEKGEDGQLVIVFVVRDTGYGM
ncbi:MAG: hypothetical protein LBH95_04415, partial [Oscillospiraceae bacterium]|nr:hypothetical protein [Oscillospiraceae bacterium]